MKTDSNQNKRCIWFVHENSRWKPGCIYTQQSSSHTVSLLWQSTSYAANKRHFTKSNIKNEDEMTGGCIKGLINTQGSVRDTRASDWVIVAGEEGRKHWAVVTHWQKPDTNSVPSGERCDWHCWRPRVSGAHHTGRDPPQDTAQDTSAEQQQSWDKHTPDAPQLTYR